MNTKVKDIFTTCLLRLPASSQIFPVFHTALLTKAFDDPLPHEKPAP